MTHLLVPAKLAEEIRREAKWEGVQAEALLEEAWRHYRMLANRKKINAESEWWKNRPEKERARFKGEYVAVHRKAVVDHDPDRGALHGRIRKKYGKTAVLITPAEGPREIRILSPRLEHR